MGGWGGVSSIFFNLLNSMIYDLKRSIDLRWLFDLVLYSFLDDLVDAKKGWCSVVATEFRWECFLAGSCIVPSEPREHPGLSGDFQFYLGFLTQEEQEKPNFHWPWLTWPLPPHCFIHCFGSMRSIRANKNSDFVSGVVIVAVFRVQWHPQNEKVHICDSQIEVIPKKCFWY